MPHESLHVRLDPFVYPQPLTGELSKLNFTLLTLLFFLTTFVLYRSSVAFFLC